MIVQRFSRWYVSIDSTSVATFAGLKLRWWLIKRGWIKGPLIYPKSAKRGQNDL